MNKKIKYLPIGILTLTTALSAVGLSSARVAADTSASKAASVTVSSACTFTNSTSYTSNISVYAGSTSNTETDSAKGATSVTCNNPDGFKVKAVGFSPTAESDGKGVEGATALYGAKGTIPTGTAETIGADKSYWSFKVTYAYSTVATTIPTAYNNTYAAVPSEATEVVSFAGTSSNTIMGIFRTDYQVHAGLGDPAGTFSGAVKYTIAMN